MSTEATAIMRRTPAILQAVIAGFPHEHMDEPPAPNEWSAAQILAHLVDVEDLLSQRVESMIASDSPQASVSTAGSSPPRSAKLLRRWLDARDRTIERLGHLTPEDLRHGAELRRWGRISVEEQVWEWAYHDLEHIRQLLATEEALLYPRIGGFRGLYAPPYPAGAPAAGRA